MKQLSFLFLLTVITIKSFSQAGILDQSFKGGIITTSLSTDDEFARGVSIQQDGKIIVAGNVSFNDAYADFALARYNADGTMDSHFGMNGKVITGIGESDDVANAIALQPDGKILAAGYSYVGSHFDFALARFHEDGSIDKSFGTEGKVVSSMGKFDDVINSIALQADGKIVVAGYSDDGRKSQFALARYNANGTPDASFGANGIVIFSIGKMNDVIRSMAVQPDGKIVVAGFSNNGRDDDFALARINSNGTPDNSFGVAGIVLTSFSEGNDEAESLAIQPEGKIVVAGESFGDSGDDFAVVRYTRNGRLDDDFGINGKVRTAIAQGAGARAVAIQPDGKIIVAGLATADERRHFALACYNSDGTSDETFNYSGSVITGVGALDDEATSVAIQPDGKIVVAGYSDNGADYDVAVVRFDSELNPENETSEKISQIKVYPNPASDYLQFDLEGMKGNTELNVFNVMGEKMKSVNWSASDNNSFSLDISALPAGAYQIVLRNNETVKTGNFVKQ